MNGVQNVYKVISFLTSIKINASISWKCVTIQQQTKLYQFSGVYNVFKCITQIWIKLNVLILIVRIILYQARIQINGVKIVYPKIIIQV